MDSGSYVYQALELLSSLIDYDLRPLAPFVAPAVIFGIPVLTLYIKFRARMKDLDHIRQQLGVTATKITTTTQGEIGNLLGKFESLHNRLDDKLTNRIDGLQTLLRSSVEVTTKSDTDIEETAEEIASRPPKLTRLRKAENVRNTVLSKWLDGTVMARTDDDPNIYRFQGKSEAGEEFIIELWTPYRATIGDDGRLPFAIDVWVNGYKHMNFEWDSEGQYALRGLKKGDWFEDITNWSMKAPRRSRRAA